ncbi:MAG: sigma-70 family RNA polymerase sigma factor [Myxococcota bacterium]
MVESAFFEQLRPELHRYCARLTGSVIEGEDLVQETLVEILRSAPNEEPARLRAWAFRTAHNRAVDKWRSYEHRMREPLEAALDQAGGNGADDALAQHEAVHAALSRFVALPPLQRSSVILKDVLDLTLEEIASLLATSVPAVQAALHRGRRGLLVAAELPDPSPSPLLARYAKLFAARDWDALRALLAEDVRLDVVGRFSKRGRDHVGDYFGRYADIANWTAELVLLDAHVVLFVTRGNGERHPIALVTRGDKILEIHDYFHVPYIARDAVTHATTSSV